MDVCLIGGTGLISTGIARQAVDTGHGVTAFHRGETDADLPEAVTHVHGDRNDDAIIAAWRAATDDFADAVGE